MWSASGFLAGLLLFFLIKTKTMLISFQKAFFLHIITLKWEKWIYVNRV